MKTTNEPVTENGQAEPTSTEPLFVTAAELAQLLRISTRTLWRLLSAHKIPEPIRIGGAAAAHGARGCRAGILHRAEAGTDRPARGCLRGESGRQFRQARLTHHDAGPTDYRRLQIRVSCRHFGRSRAGLPAGDPQI